MRALVIDDSPSIQLIASALAGQSGHETLSGGPEDLDRLLARGPFDAAAIDLRMPDKEDGVRAVAVVLASGVPIVVLMTGASPDEVAIVWPRLMDLTRSASARLQVLYKPFSVSELLGAMGLEVEAVRAQ